MGRGKDKKADPLAVALGFLSYRDRTEHETRQRLKKEERYGEEEIDAAITYLIEAGYLNDHRFATELAGSRIRNKAWGRYKIALDLKRRKIADEVVEEVVATIDDETETKTATEAIEKWLRKSGLQGPLSAKEFKRAQRHLSSRGFSIATALGVLEKYRGTGTEYL